MTTAAATPKQISFALALLARNGYRTDFMNKDFGRWATMRERSGKVETWLASLSKQRISDLITDLNR